MTFANQFNGPGSHHKDTSREGRSTLTPDEPIGRNPVISPRGLNRQLAANYVGISPSKYDELVKDGRMPKPRRIDGRVVWDRFEVDDKFEALPHDGEVARNPWDD